MPEDINNLNSYKCLKPLIEPFINNYTHLIFNEVPNDMPFTITVKVPHLTVDCEYGNVVLMQVPLPYILKKPRYTKQILTTNSGPTFCI